jgi:hypothetical protein
MSQSEATTWELLDVSKLGKSSEISNAHLQEILQAAVLLFSARVQEGVMEVPFADERAVSATDVAIASTAMLNAVNVQVFELGLWQAWQGNA